MANGVSVFEMQVGFALPRRFQLIVAAAGCNSAQRAGDTALESAGGLTDHRHLTPRVASRGVIRRHHRLRDEMANFDRSPDSAAAPTAEQPVTNAAYPPADAGLRYRTGNNLRAVKCGIHCRHAGRRQHHGHTEGFKGQPGLSGRRQRQGDRCISLALQ